jgi:tetratricopeptide (TPR) repeat protein
MPTRKPSSLLALFLLALLGTAPGRAAADETRAAEIYRRVLRSTAYVEAPGLGSGTAWVADRGRRLLVTNQHVVGNKDTVLVLFPAYQDGEVIAERSAYKHRQPVRGRVVCTTVEQDLAVIQLDSLPADVQDLPLASRSPSPGEPVYSVGNPGASGALWVFTTGRVRAVYRKRFATQGGQAVVWRYARIVETSSPTNGGDSGGPVVNERGDLVAVTESGNTTARLVTTFIDVSEVRQFLAEVRRIMDPQTEDDYYLRGWRFELEGRWDKAVAAYTEVIRRNPHNSWAYNGRGNCFFAKKDYDTATADYGEALRLDPRYAFAYHNRGSCWRMKKDFDRAIADYTRAIQLKPDYADALLGRGNCYLDKGQHERAIADYNRAIALYTENPGPAAVWAFNGRGLCNLNLEHSEAAIADFTAALKLNPYQAPVWANLGETHYRKKNYEEALKAALRAVELDANDPYAWRILGNVFYSKRDTSKAVFAYTQAIRRDARDAYSYYWRSQAYRALGDKERARSDYAQAARLDRRYARQG